MDRGIEVCVLSTVRVVRKEISVIVEAVEFRRGGYNHHGVLEHRVRYST